MQEEELSLELTKKRGLFKIDKKQREIEEVRRNIQLLEHSIENLQIKKKFLTSSMALREDEDAVDRRKRERNEKRLEQSIKLCA